MKLRWKLDDLAADVWPAVIWKLLRVIDARLRDGKTDTRSLLARYDWCVAAARTLTPNHSKNPAALRLVASGRVPSSVAEAAGVLKEPVKDFRALDEAVWAQFGLSLWPLLAASLDGDKVVIRNVGIGSALSLVARPADTPSGGTASPAVDVLPGQSISLSLPGRPTAIAVTFEKFAAQHHVTLDVAADGAIEATTHARPPDHATSSEFEPVDVHELVKVGKTWKLRFAGVEASLPDRVGLSYLQKLVANAGHPVDAENLIGTAPFACTSRQTALDPLASRELRANILDAKERLADAEKNDDLGTVDATRNQLRELAAELDRSTRPGGKVELGSDRTRGRGSVANAIRRALAEIKVAHRAAHDHFRTHLKNPTGFSPSYEPPPGTRWLVNPAGSDPGSVGGEDV